MWSMWEDFVNEWVYIECGPNFAEVGRVAEVKVDNLGRGWGILDEAGRVDNEEDSGPTYLGAGTGSRAYKPDTEITHIQRCDDRWASGWSKPGQ